MEIIEKINLYESGNFAIIENSDKYNKLVEEVKSKNLNAILKIDRMGSIKTKNYFSQIVVSISDMQRNILSNPEEPIALLETFSENVYQTKFRIRFYSILDDEEFWESIDELCRIVKNLF